MLVKAVKNCFDYFIGRMRGSGGVLDHEVLVLQILSALCKLPSAVMNAVGVSQVGALETLQPAQRQVQLQ